MNLPVFMCIIPRSFAEPGAAEKRFTAMKKNARKIKQERECGGGGGGEGENVRVRVFGLSGCTL